MHPIRLSEKAWNFVESRHGDMPVDEYVSMLIENVADLSSDGNLMPEGMRMIEVIEAQKSSYCPADTGCREKASEIMGYLREAFHGKVPRAIFRRKCAERGGSMMTRSCRPSWNSGNGFPDRSLPGR